MSDDDKEDVSFGTAVHRLRTIPGTPKEEVEEISEAVMRMAGGTLPYVPKPGDIGIVHMTGAGGAAIRLGQWFNGDGFADYEHAFVVAGIHVRGEDRDVADGMKIVEAMPGGALLSPLSRYDGLDPVYLRCPDDLRSAVAGAALDLVGTPYSVADYFALAAHRFHIPAPGLKHFVETSNHMICSQLADRAADVSGWHLFVDGRWPGYVTPGDLYGLYRFMEPVYASH
jgi:hypothetical protein